MTLAALADRPLARRLAALSLLGVVVFLAAPLVGGPLAAWQEGRAAVEAEREVLDRLARAEARRAAVAGLAARPDTPLIVAPDRAGALAALSARAALAAPPGMMTIGANQPVEGGEDKPGAPARLLVQFTATPAGLYGFLRDLETKAPFVRVDGFSTALVSDPKSGAPALLAGSAELSAVPLVRGVSP